MQLPSRNLRDNRRQISLEQVILLQVEKSKVEKNYPSDRQPREWLCYSLNDGGKSL